MLENMKTNFWKPKGDSSSATLFIISFEMALPKVREKLNENNTRIEHSYTKQDYNVRMMKILQIKV